MKKQADSARYRCRLRAVPVTSETALRDAWLRRAAAMSVFRGTGTWIPRDTEGSGKHGAGLQVLH